MKNKEETTARHYNLLSNQRHAVNIAMQLYNSFSEVDGMIIEVSKVDSEMFSKRIQESTENVGKEKVLSWLKKHNSDISKSEIAEICSYLEEFSAPANPSSFYPRKVLTYFSFSIFFVHKIFIFNQITEG